VGETKKGSKNEKSISPRSGCAVCLGVTATKMLFLESLIDEPFEKSMTH